MRIVRAWPDFPPAGRAHVIDGWPKVTVDDYDYAPLLAVGDDVISMDWDTAVSREDLLAFAAHAAATPARVLVAPVRMYKRQMGAWNLARYDDRGGDHPVTEGCPTVHVFGFGMVYLPRALLAAFTAAHPGRRVDDVTFSNWHFEHVAQEVRVDWTVRPVHLHYPESDTGALAAV